MAVQQKVVLVIPVPTLSIADDLMVVMLNEAIYIDKVSVFARAYTSGTFTLVVKNNAGTTLATVNVTAAGATALAAPTVNQVAAADKLRVGITGLGVGVLDVTVTIWAKVTSG